MKARNLHYYGTQDEVNRLAEDYRFLGRNVIVEPNHLTVLALPIRKQKKKIEPRGQNRSAKVDANNEDQPTRSNDRKGSERRGMVQEKSQRPKG